MASHLFEYSSLLTLNGLGESPLPIFSSIYAVLFKVNYCDSLEPTGLTVPFSTHLNPSFWWFICIAFGTEFKLMG
jgi:hypothetical protein